MELNNSLIYFYYVTSYFRDDFLILETNFQKLLVVSQNLFQRHRDISLEVCLLRCFKFLILLQFFEASLKDFLPWVFTSQFIDSAPQNSNFFESQLSLGLFLTIFLQIFPHSIKSTTPNDDSDCFQCC